MKALVGWLSWSAHHPDTPRLRVQSQAGHRQESTNEWEISATKINVCLSVSLPSSSISLKSILKYTYIKFLEEKAVLTTRPALTSFHSNCYSHRLRPFQESSLFFPLSALPTLLHSVFLKHPPTLVFLKYPPCYLSLIHI